MNDLFLAFEPKEDITAIEVARVLESFPLFVSAVSVAEHKLDRHFRPMTEAEKELGRAQGIPQEEKP